MYATSACKVKGSLKERLCQSFTVIVWFTVGVTLARLPHFSLILLYMRKLAILFHLHPFFFRPFFFGALSKGESNEGKSKIGRLNEGISKGD